MKRRTLLGGVAAGFPLLAGCAFPSGGNGSNPDQYNLTVNNDTNSTATVTVGISNGGTQLFEETVEILAGGEWKLDEDFDTNETLTVRIATETGLEGAHYWSDPRMGGASLIVSINPDSIEFERAAA